MIKVLIDFISKFFSITGNGLLDTIIYANITYISFIVAYGLVGGISNITRNYDSEEMSKLHWIIRFIVFIVLIFFSSHQFKKNLTISTIVLISVDVIIFGGLPKIKRI